ncbi:MAG: alpha/beta hydrolase [Anaerolineales bacterium]
MTTQALANFVHVFLDHAQEKTLFLLHGTGGDEGDLIPLVEPAQAAYNFVGLRGNVLEGGMPRFFARSAPGVFDQQSIATESDKLAAFVHAWYAEHKLTAEQATFVGFSNGANMLLATLWRHPEMIQSAAFLHPMQVFAPPAVDLAGRRVLVTLGLADSMIPAGEGEQVAAALQARGAQVQVFSHPGGHQITAQEQAALLDFLG